MISGFDKFGIKMISVDKEIYFASVSRLAQSLFRRAVLAAKVTRMTVMTVTKNGLRPLAGFQRTWAPPATRSTKPTLGR